ncbi:MAG: alginate export family protein [Verrucomicrobiales bacterium]|nr:alginate export family protein [Verrucomicrobiales bacterium]
MNQHRRLHLAPFALGAFALAQTSAVHAQYAPPPPPRPFQGFLNEWLRKDDPYMAAWDIGGSVRMRYELKDNFGIAGAPRSLDFRNTNADVDNAYLMERIRLRVGYTAPWWSALVEGRSSLVQEDDRFASTAPVVYKGRGPEADSIDLHQAYMTLGNHKEFPLSLKVGRQELSYGEERLIGAFAWNNIGRVFDAAKMRWQNAWFGADFFTSRVVIPEDSRFNVSNDYDYFSGFYATSPLIQKHSLDFYFLARNASTKAARAELTPQAPQPSARDIYTLGARLKSSAGQFGNWDYTLDLMGQFGHFNDTRAGVPLRSQEHLAYAYVLQGGYTFPDSFGTPRIGLEYSHGSGDSNPRDDKHGTFENLFPTNHKFYGYMDFVSLQNIHDVRVIYQLKPHARLSIALEGHLFWLANTSDNFYNVGGAPRGGGAANGTGYGVNSNYGSFVGSEVDLIAGYALTRFAQLEVGFGHFFAGSYIDKTFQGIGGSADANYLYTQLNVNF